MTYDNHTYQVVIHVEDEGGGKLTPTVSINGAVTSNAVVTLTNTYSKDRITVPINAKKTLNGSSLYANRFTFLLEKNGDPSYQRMTGNYADGRIVFDIEYFTQPGIYYYTLTEVDSGDDNITYDKTAYTVILEIDRVNTDGPLSANITYINDKTGEKLSGNAIPNFVNTYSDANNPDSGPGWTPDPDNPSLNMEDHLAYLIGYNDGTVRPEANITRAEAVTIFFRLLTDDLRSKYWSTTNPYSDVAQPVWYNNAISTMSNLGVIGGYSDGTFRPNANITRSELTKIAVSLLHYADLQLTGSTIFDDVPQDEWYTKFVEAATELDLIEGYPDNTFHPDDDITRAEAVTIINRLLKRSPHRNGLLANMITWPDNMNVDAWYYADIQEATSSHKFQTDLYRPNGTFERWIALLPVRDWAIFERMWAYLYGSLLPM